MESIADLLGNHTGEIIEVRTNGSELLAGIVEDVHPDYFVLSSATRLYFVPYTGISTFYFPPTPESQQAPLDAQKSSERGKDRKSAKRTKA